MSELVWEEPPARTSRTATRDHAAIAAQLKSRPGQWAVIEAGERNNMNNVAMRIKRGDLPAYRPAGAFEAVTRTKDGEVRVYARYTGGEGA
jgi:hypothetical protein